MDDERDEAALRLPELEPEPSAEEGPGMDAAESRWDPWLRALARIEAAREAPLN